MVTLPDITLSQHTLETFPRLKRLRSDLLRTPAHVCIERARHVTHYLRDMSSDAEPMQLRYARAVNYFLSRKAPLFFDSSLLAGTTTSKPFGAPVYPEFTGMTIWPELETISTRSQNPQVLSQDDADELNYEIYPYWMERNILEYTRRKHGNPACMRLFERIVFFIASKAGCISHTVPDYSVVLARGVQHITAEAARRETMLADSAATTEGQKKIQFYQSVQIAMQGVIAYARNLSQQAARMAAAAQESAQRANLLEMAEVCSRVPARPARNFREALNALWIVHVAVHAESINMAMSPGRLDQLLYPYYRKDILDGVMDERDAIELLGCLFIKLNDNTNLVPETAEELYGGAGTVPAVTVGGVDPQGEDAVNDLTYIILRVTELLKTRDPSLNARYHGSVNSSVYLRRVAEVIRNTRSVPAIHNDRVDIDTLVNQGTALQHARDYAIIGCVELASAGRSYDASSSIMLNLASALELALYDGTRPVTGDEQIGPRTGDPAHFTHFGQFWDAFKSQLTWLIDQAVELNELFGRTYQEILPTPLLSAFFEGPMASGRDLIDGGALYNSSGATHIGFADTVDSLNAIETAVFIDRECTLGQLLQALRDDFQGHERLHEYLLNQAPKYGTCHPIARKNAQNLIRFLYEQYQTHENYRGGRYRPGYWTMTNHAGQGKLSGALPNGRRAHQVFASGITPVSQAAGDLTECLQEVGRLDYRCIPSGEALNLKYASMEREADLEIFCQLVQTYFESGGLHVQFNIMSYEDLLEARDHPEKHPELLVRVSGYSAYFNDLNDAMKEEIILRTAYDLGTRQAIPFPG